ncbi:hypothetical protein [Methylobacterium sp. ARG-1]|uniref:hypothetical protein n=1 Tax=Methylobacterium sp. ARG-1 TaxID=1692501 RepID=UPI001FCD9569|nr:hypothetical protein [Methylobacterium sp. ARG-1]
MAAYSLKKQFAPPSVAGTMWRQIQVGRKRHAHPGDRFQSVEESYTDLISLTPDQFGSQPRSVFRHQQVEVARYDGCTGKSQPGPVSGHVADQAIDDTIAGIEGDLSGQICPPAVQFSTFNRHGRSQDGTDRAVHHSLSNLGAALAPADALEIAGAA